MCMDNTESLFKRSLTKRIKGFSDRTDLCGTQVLIDSAEEQWPTTDAAIEHSERKSKMKVQIDGEKL